MLKKITNGNKVTENISYLPLDTKSKQGQFPVYYSTSHIGNYPNIDILNDPNFFVVTMLERNSANSYKKKLFQYYSAVSNIEGLGFLGFKSVTQTNWHDDRTAVISYVSKNDMSLRGANTENYTVLGLHEPLFDSPNQIESSIVKENYTVTGQESLVAAKSIVLKPNTWIKPESTFSAKINSTANNSINEPSSFITKSLLTYENESSANKVYKIKNTAVKQFNGLENTTSETKIDYNNYNNPTKITVVNVGEGTTQTSVTDIAYQNLESPAYIVGRPSSKIQNVTLGSEKMRTEELYEYNSQQLLFQTQKKGDETTNYITENRIYDVFGNITKRTLKAGQDTREFNYEYDSSGRFLNKETDAEKLVTSYLYNPNGTLKSTTNPLLQTTSFEYDSWFRKKYETNYLGNTNEYKYVNSNGNTIVTKIYADGNVAEETFNDLGYKIKSGAKNIMGSFNYVSYDYDAQDRNYKVSEPYIGTAPSQWNETKYDDYGRIETQTAYTGKTTNFLYTGLTTKVNDGTISKTYKKDAAGNVISMFDVPSNEIKYTYFANGELKEMNYDGIRTKFLQDGWGRKKQIDDPSAGIFKYTYNDFGELISEENKNGVTSYKLTSEGRLDEKTISGLYNSKTKYTYDGTNKLLLNSQFNDGVNTIKTDYIYDDKKRINTTIETTPFAVFTKDYRYDSYGRLLTEGSTASRLGGKASSKTVKYGYKNGALYQIFDNGTNALLWQTNTINARGQLLTAQNGPLTLTNEYDDYGYSKQFKFDKTTPSVNILSLGTSFNLATGNLDNRTNSLFAWNESFNYDNFDRLTEFNGINGLKQTQAYDNKGRITQNSLGTYVYSNEKPYQNASITVSPEALDYYTAKPSQIIDYNVFKSPVLINEKDVDKVSFDYNDSNYRTVMFYGDLQDDKLKRPFRKYYSADGTMEIKENRTTGVIDFVTYIGGDGYTAPIVFKSNGEEDQKYLFLQRDYQNSIVAITDPSGAVVEKRIFDAWGAIAKVQDGAGSTLSGLTILDRGYTGHEHLQSVGLINMNARLYDPKLHRFLQPDNNIQDPFNTQNYNRYGYVLNNPLKYTDPSGEFWQFVAMALSVYIYGGAATGEVNPLKWNMQNLMGIGSGLATAYATGATNSYIDNYNNKRALGASAVGFNLPSFVNDDNYIDITKVNEKRGGIGNDVIPCVACHHTLDRGDVFESELLQPDSKFGNGLKNTVFGVVATVGAVAAIPETGGGSGIALSFTIGQTSIGIAQMADSFNEKPSEVLHNYSTVPGLIAGQRGSKYAPMIDFTSAWITGSMNSSNLLGNYNGFRSSVNQIYRGERLLYNGTSIYSTYSTVNSGVSASYLMFLKQ
ncbi:tRNA(Glu)-specific nuclease WapA precursor [compost metagenome]